MSDKFIENALNAYFEDVHIASTQVMAQGRENKSILVEGNFGKVVVRVWGDRHGYMGVRKEGDIASELAFMQFCYDRHFPVPRLYASKNGRSAETLPDGAQYAVIGYVEGEQPVGFTGPMIHEVATVMARLHNAVADFSFPHKRSWPGTLIEMTSDRIQRFESTAHELNAMLQESIAHIIAGYKERLARNKAALSLLPTGVIHGDIMRENIKFIGDKLEGIFDFDDCRESYFLEDIAKTLLFEFESQAHCMFSEDGKSVAAFFEAYSSVRSLSETEESLLSFFFTARVVYQLIGYYLKLERDSSYLDKIAQTVDRYNQNRLFFEG